MPVATRREVLAPWALRPTIRAEVARPESPGQVAPALTDSPGGVTPMGARTAYGDVAVNPGGCHLSTARLDKLKPPPKKQDADVLSEPRTVTFPDGRKITFRRRKRMKKEVVSE